MGYKCHSFEFSYKILHNTMVWYTSKENKDINISRSLKTNQIHQSRSYCKVTLNNSKTQVLEDRTEHTPPPVHCPTPKYLDPGLYSFFLWIILLWHIYNLSSSTCVLILGFKQKGRKVCLKHENKKLVYSLWISYSYRLSMGRNMIFWTQRLKHFCLKS